MINFDYLIGKSLTEAEALLKRENIEYIIIETKGYKDKLILVESYVLRAIEKDGKLALTTGLFKTTI